MNIEDLIYPWVLACVMSPSAAPVASGVAGDGDVTRRRWTGLRCGRNLGWLRRWWGWRSVSRRDDLGGGLRHVVGDHLPDHLGVHRRRRHPQFLPDGAATAWAHRFFAHFFIWGPRGLKLNLPSSMPKNGHSKMWKNIYKLKHVPEIWHTPTCLKLACFFHHHGAPSPCGLATFCFPFCFCASFLMTCLGASCCPNHR